MLRKGDVFTAPNRTTEPRVYAIFWSCHEPSRMQVTFNRANRLVSVKPLQSTTSDCPRHTTVGLQTLQQGVRQGDVICPKLFTAIIAFSWFAREDLNRMLIDL
ncbi:unnamed protein product [Pieris macdunnoughi]|uniref:Uncharacterized protein n=1 Tax=Pieris macdunnoughi TaxID=345717 RepID=A0A821SHQ0_9NEOP|nr:unnamed protein product [Pieris macdunnoughi]